MTLKIETTQDATVVTPMGPRIDSLATLEFKEKMRGIIEKSTGNILLDLREVDFIDSSGLGAIVAIAKQLGNARQLELTHLRPMVAKVFELTKMDGIFTIHKFLPDPERL